LEPIVCVYETGANKKEVQQGDMLCQIFNFIDVLGGKEGMAAGNLERVLKTRGILKGSDKEAQELNSALQGQQ